MLVISAAAAAEASRLEKQAVRIEPVKMSTSLLSRASGIDGAVLLGTTGNCHAIGIILDGMASPRGTPARGSRYNSAIRYVYSQVNCVAVVVSEDGMVDVVPNLMPRIRRSELKRALEDLRRVAGQKEVHPRDLSRVRDWFLGHRFYLTSEQCEEVNQLVKQGMDRYPEGTCRVEHGPFSPNPDMQESYLLDD
jgi:hypothetical protein